MKSYRILFISLEIKDNEMMKNVCFVNDNVIAVAQSEDGYTFYIYNGVNWVEKANSQNLVTELTN